jgi:hypothetical protein
MAMNMSPYLSKVLTDDNQDKEQIRQYDMFEVILTDVDLSTNIPGKHEMYVYKLNVTHTRPIIGHSRPVPYSQQVLEGKTYK